MRRPKGANLYSDRFIKMWQKTMGPGLFSSKPLPGWMHVAINDALKLFYTVWYQNKYERS